MAENTTKIPRSTTNADLAITLALIQDKVIRLDNAVNGNGKPGLLDEFREFTQRFRDITQRIDKVEQQIVEHILDQNAATKDAKDLLATEAKASVDLLASEAKVSKEVLASEAKVASDRKDKISNRVWAIIIIVTTALVGNMVGTAFLLIQNSFAK